MANTKSKTGLDTVVKDDTKQHVVCIALPVIVLQAGHVGRTKGKTGAPGKVTIETDGKKQTIQFNEQEAAGRVVHVAADLLTRCVSQVADLAGVEVAQFGADDVQDYRKDGFHDPVAVVAVHCDGSDTNPSAGGYSFGYAEGNSDSFALRDALEAAYLEVQQTGWVGQRIGSHARDNYTDDLKYYYLWRSGEKKQRIPSTSPAVLIELGFLSNAAECRAIFDNADVIGYGVALAVARFLRGWMADRYPLLGKFPEPLRIGLPPDVLTGTVGNEATSVPAK